MPGLGEAFRAAREARNLSLSDVADQIHIRSVYLQAIEEEDWSAIAAPVYVRGFIRTYARFLGLDPQIAIEQFNAVAGETTTVQAPVTVSAPRRRPSIWLWVGGAAAALLVGLVAFNYLQLQRSSVTPGTADASPAALITPSAPATVVAASSPEGTASAAAGPSTSPEGSPAATSPAPGSVSPSPAASASPKAKPGSALAIRFVQKSWVRVDVDGQNKEEGVFDKGVQLNFNGKVATVRAGNAAGVDVTVNGKHQGPLGAAGDVVERTYALTNKVNG
jgi:cytoskeleton protein RodZ